MRHVTFKQLRAVAAIARHGTIVRAAEEISLTPAALAARLKQLEDDLEMPLFDRTQQGLRVTEAGKELLIAAERIENAIDDCINGIERLRTLDGGRVTVAMVSTAKYFVPRAVAVFSRLHPNIELRLLTGNRFQTVAALRSYEADLAIMGRPPLDIAVDSAVFGVHPFVVVAAPSHPLAGAGRVPQSSLLREPFVVREQGSGTRAVFESFASQLPLRPRVPVEIDNNETLKRAIAEGVGIAVLSAHTVATEVAEGQLVLLDVEGFPVRREWHIVRRADRSGGPAAQTFWAFLLQDGEGLLPSIPGLCLPS